MARIHPHGWQELAADLDGGQAASLGLQRELDTLRRLAAALPDSFTIYHGVHWTHLSGPHTVIDDIDFVIVGPDGRLLLIEQVAGFLSETPQGLQRKRPGKAGSTLLASTLAHTVATLGGRLRRALADGSAQGFVPRLDALLYCPDYTVRNAGTAGLPPERIVDAGRREALPAIIDALLRADGGDAPGAETRETAAPETLAKLHRFFAELLQLSPEASAIVGEAEGLTTRLSGGLAAWARRLSFAPHRLRVIGTAGSGKTQLALAVIRDAVAAGRRPLYVCYNRPLADHVAAVLEGAGLGRRTEAGTYHQLCDHVARAVGRAPDFTLPDAFRRLEGVIDALSADELAAWQFDELIVDEGQDFEPAWANALFRLLAPGGRAWWLEDPRQNLYGRPPLVLPAPADWVELRCGNNYRTPRAIHQYLAATLGEPDDAASDPAEGAAGSPIVGKPPELLTYRDEAGLIEQTKRAIGLGIAAGFKRSMIAVLSFRGREKSRLSGLDKLGPYGLKSFTGRYDLLGNPIYSDGEIVLDSIMRFKGQAAPCVVLTEIAFAELDENTRRRLFVGATRATLALFLVADETSARLLQPAALP